MIKHFMLSDPLTKIAYVSVATAAVVFGLMILLTQLHP
jgi:hypothetical protein